MHDDVAVTLKFLFFLKMRTMLCFQTCLSNLSAEARGSSQRDSQKQKKRDFLWLNHKTESSFYYFYVALKNVSS